MTDQPQAGAAAAAPITVKAHAASVAMPELFKVGIVAGGALAADRLMHSDIAIAAVIPVFALVASAAWGLMQRIQTWKALKMLAAHAPDEVATVGKPT